tara:strand:+ start:9 stop:743 length:735 start_codon:yes stop_codon:yes gene_type:complete
MKPTGRYKHFFIIGAQRSATTFLKKQLNKAPEIKMNTNPNGEPKIFLKKKFSYKNYLNDYYPKIPNEVSWLGEKSTSYYENIKCAKVIKKKFPSSLIICILRNPSMRAISNYYFSKKNKLEKRNINEAFEKKVIKKKYKTSVSPFRYIERGKYYSYLKHWKKIFGKNLIVLISEKIVSDISEINKIFKKLKVKYRLKKSNITKKKLNEYNDYKHYKLIQKLNKIYKKPNSELSKKFNISLRDWK